MKTATKTKTITVTSPKTINKSEIEKKQYFKSIDEKRKYEWPFNSLPDLKIDVKEFKLGLND